MYHWTPDMIRFMADASAYGDYHQRIAEMLLPYLGTAGQICDAGCGLGDLSVALAPFVPGVTCVEIKPQAAAFLRAQCAAKNITNIEVLEGDIRLLPPREPYDAMIFSFFGRSEEILEIAGAQCKGTVTVIKKNYSIHRFSVGNHPTGPDGYSHMQALLTERGIPFESRTAALEFGQPFHCFEDVRAFYNCYSRDEDPGLMTDAFLRSRVVETGREDFPLYMPHQRQIGLICFQSGDIR